LSVKNPNKGEEQTLRDPQEILAEIAALDAETAKLLDGIRGMLYGGCQQESLAEIVQIPGTIDPTT
jgi:hypothetical protein